MKSFLLAICAVLFVIGCKSVNVSHWYLKPQNTLVAESSFGIEAFNNCPPVTMNFQGDMFTICNSLNAWLAENLDRDAVIRIDVSLVEEFHPTPRACLARLSVKVKDHSFENESAYTIMSFLAREYQMEYTPTSSGFVFYPEELSGLYINLNRELELAPDLESGQRGINITIFEIVSNMNFLIPSDQVTICMDRRLDECAHEVGFHYDVISSMNLYELIDLINQSLHSKSKFIDGSILFIEPKA